MGLIKTAMLAGAGMYAVNKIAKTTENRQSNPRPVSSSQPQYVDQSQTGQRDNYYNPQAPGQGSQKSQMNIDDQGFPRDVPQGSQSFPLQFEGRRSPDQRGRPLYLTNDAQTPLPNWYNNGVQDYEFDPRNANGNQYAYAGSAPPQYRNSYARQQRGFVEPDEDFESDYQQGSARGSSGSMAFLSTLASQAMAMDGDDKKSKGGKGGKGDMLAKLLK